MLMVLWVSMITWISVFPLIMSDSFLMVYALFICEDYFHNISIILVIIFIKKNNPFIGKKL